MSKKIKPIAIYLPQYHPIPENDKWWGKGFTEWTNVAKSKPLFEGHYQPHLPKDLGYYDLRLDESRNQQAELAKKYGIHGFCYYHYWFNGKKILERPFQEVFDSKKPNFPFMLCWANENWTRAWDGGEKEILIEQKYSVEDDKNHINHLIQYFKDERYIKVDGKPVLIIYRPNLLPNIVKTIKIWREEVRKNGFEDVYLGFSQNSENLFNPKEYGFDFAFEFQPNFSKVPLDKSIKKRIKHKLYKFFGLDHKEKRIYDYEEFSKIQMSQDFKKNVYPGITPMWDNSARRKNNPFILHNSSPKKYKNWLEYIKRNYPWSINEEEFLFINAWNEWAEGNHLEPCMKWGLKYLEATKEVLNEK